MAKSDATEPWERQPRESDEAWQAFTRFRDMPLPRRVVSVARELGKSKTLIERWCQRWQWQERVRCYDNALEQKAFAELQRQRVEFRKRAANQARAKAQTLMMPDVRLSQMLAQMPVERLLEGMTALQLIALSSKASLALPGLLKAEALALGEATERVDEPRPVEEDPLSIALKDSPDARSLIAGAIERATVGQDDANGLRDGGESGSVEKPTPSHLSGPGID